MIRLLWVPLSLCLVFSHAFGFDLDEIEQFEQLETLDLFEAATRAAERDNISEAERLLNKARTKSSVRDGESGALDAIDKAKSRIAERRRRKEERLAAENRIEDDHQRHATTSGISYEPSRADFYNACLGSTLAGSNCYHVDDPDLQRLCLARSKREDAYCYQIRSGDMKNLCLGISNSNYASNCHRISDDGMKGTCLAVSSYRYADRCYTISGGPWKLFCGGLALSPDNCYRLN